jgi:diguanylate cyclase (GGDEF)-like protein
MWRQLAAWRDEVIKGLGDRRFALARLVPALAVLVLILGVAFAGAGYFFARESDARQEARARAALSDAMEAIRARRGESPKLDARDVQILQRSAGVTDLKIEAEPSTAGRNVQLLLGANGRIAGWLSWEAQHPMTDLLVSWWPVAAVLLTFLSALAWLSVWQLRRALRVLDAAEKRAATLEHTDTLTGLPHHRRILDLLEAEIADCRPDRPAVFAHLDIDGFTEINAMLGHAAGDELLAAMAARLRQSLPDGALRARFGGDEFAVLICGRASEDPAEGVASLIAALERPYWAAGRAVKITLCAGYARCPRDAIDRDALARCADLALRAAKGKGRGAVLAFDPGMDRDAAERRFIEGALKGALAAEDIEVHYQPVVAAEGARIVGVEALLRWTHPERGAVAPPDIIAVAENCGLMSELGAFVLRRALADAKRWPDLFVAVNLSPLQVRDAALVPTVDRLLAANRIAPSRLLLEITEGVLIDDPAAAKPRLDALRALGVRIALDDFGTGYSSLGYLQRFAFDKLKIDKSFVTPLGRAGNAGALIQAIVTLARALGMSVLAEGVETEEQRVLLRLAGCDEMQGFLFARAGPRETIDRLVAQAAAAPDRRA